MITVASYGGGTNSTAMIIESIKRKEKIDLILFADTGRRNSELPTTYAYIDKFDQWLKDHDMPRITWVRVKNESLEEDCLRRHALPAIAYGWKTCSLRFKAAPQEVFINNYPPAQKEWRQGNKVVKLIGYHADEPERAKDFSDKKFIVRYPLVEWGINQADCEAIIKEAGLCVPVKSACSFCPSRKPGEIRQMAEIYPELTERALKMESNADLTAIKGLGRNFSWSDILKQKEMYKNSDYSTPEISCGCGF